MIKLNKKYLKKSNVIISILIAWYVVPINSNRVCVWDRALQVFWITAVRF